ncbi:acyltransferase [Reinekea sp. G2M2-21]|uniref:acyltransferase family protein n=1 Tax=Reinekea sp. G2M2-21 TaxID=2788942 RepID=UPI0018AAD582|nr:acyltransferase [Reinekea sp. G2M2-21]
MNYRIKGLDGMRAIACLLVLAHHTLPRLPTSETLLSKLVQSFGEFGQAGVSIFFVLSGYLLSIPFWRSLFYSTKRPSYTEFIKRRLARIAPGYYLVLTVTTFYALSSSISVFDSQLIVRFTSAFLFLNSFHPVTLFPADINGALWSIGFEVLCYAMLLVSMMILFHFFPSLKYSAALCFILVVGLLSIFFHLIWVSIVGIPTRFIGWDYGIIGYARSWMPYTNPFSLFNHFVIGIIFGSLHIYAHAKWKQHGKFDIYLILGTILSLFAGIVMIFTIDDSFSGVFHSLYFWPVFPSLIGLWLAILPLTTHLFRVFDFAPLRFIAKISFGIYIWHMLVIEWVTVWLFPSFTFNGGMPLVDWFIAMIVTITFTIGIATLSWYRVEKPCLDWFSGRPRNKIIGLLARE